MDRLGRCSDSGETAPAAVALDVTFSESLTQAFERDSAEDANSRFEEKGIAILTDEESITVNVEAVSASDLKGAEAECGGA
jgi:hypothetical protein